MAIAPTLQKYLLAENIDYDVITHEPSMSATRTAETCKISGDRLAKAVLLRSREGYLLAILPASRRVRIADGTLQKLFGCELDLATELEIAQLFQDCASGAIPPVGYGIDTIIDGSIEEQPEIYLEGGDHTILIHMSRSQFARLTHDAWHGDFSTRH